MYHDPLSMYGKISDPAALAIDPSYGFLLEETDTEDHDNDGISDLNDLDDDNDGISDLIERFDGCYGTDPFDHDNDGIQDEFDWDDDNDGLLEGPIDWSQGADPKNNTEDRYVIPTAIHPWTQTVVGTGYRIDQNLLDHDNDGVTDEDIDGNGKGSYDEDDDKKMIFDVLAKLDAIESRLESDESVNSHLESSKGLMDSEDMDLITEDATATEELSLIHI